MYEYKVRIVKVVDGDTVDVDIDLGFDVWLKNQRVRLYGIDTPERRTRDIEEKKYGKAATAYLTEKLEIGTPVLRSYGSGKFGRILGEFWIIEESHDMPGMEVKTNINQMMIEDHHAVAYHGQSKEEIAEEHIKNRQFINV